MPPSSPAEYRSTSRPESGAATATASGQGVMSSPVATSERPSTSCSQNGSATNAIIWAANEAIEVPIESRKIGMRSRSIGSSGLRRGHSRSTRAMPAAARASSARMP